ncbi:MAG: FAD-dependent oxidoreductase [Chthoniobacterales bacterium]
MKYDVLVAGGGSAGVAAAVSAAALGAKTCIIECGKRLGGMASLALVHSICGLYDVVEPSKDASPVYANDGFSKFFAEQLIASGGAERPVRLGRVNVLFHDPVSFAETAAHLVKACEKNLLCMLNSEICGAAPDLSSLEFVSKGQVQKITARSYVDASGDAVLASLCGAVCERAEPRRLQRPAFIFSVGGVAAEVVNTTGRLRLAKALGEAVKMGDLPTAAYGVTARAAHREGDIFFTVNLEADFSKMNFGKKMSAEEVYDPLDASQRSFLKSQGQIFAHDLIEYLQKKLEGFSSCYLSTLPDCLGVRESRRVRGRYQLTAEDLDVARRFEDGIGRATWPIELREKANAVHLQYPKVSGGCDLPLRILQSENREALFMAGRCVSAVHEAQAAVRVIGTCLVTGEAAGIAAALRARGEEVSAQAIKEARKFLVGRAYRPIISPTGC